MKWKNSSWLVLLMIVVACSHGAIQQTRDWALPARTDIPREFYEARRGDSQADSKLEDEDGDCESDSCHWQFQYLRALAAMKNTPEKSCELFTVLAAAQEFALQDVARLHALQACPLTEESLKNATHEADKSNPHWLQRSFKEEERRQAGELKKADLYLDLTKDLVKITPLKKNKVKLLEEALSVAKLQGENKATEFQKLLADVAPRYSPVPEDWMVTAQDAMTAKDYTLALEGFRKILISPTSSRSARRKALENIRAIYKLQQNKDRVLSTTMKLVQLDEDELKANPRDLVALKNLSLSTQLLARTHWTEHRAPLAQKILLKFEKRFRKALNIADIHTLLGRIAEEDRKYVKALQYYQKVATETGNPLERDGNSWRMAWMEMKLRILDQALGRMRELANKEQDPGRKVQQLFWVAKILKKKGDPEAVNVFNQVIELDPIGYYGAIAYYELGLKLPKLRSLEASSSRVPRKLEPEAQSQWSVLEWLIGVNELNFAQSMITEETRLPDPSIEEWNEIAQRYAHAGNFAALFGKINKLSPEEKRVLLVQHPELLFPTPFRDLVEKQAKHFGVSVDFVYSIMRQESSFNPEVISGADAYGLMQLLPVVADRMAKKIKIAYKEPDDLLDPMVNVPIGIAFLKELSDKFHGQFIMTTASYNASEDAVKNWVKTRYLKDPIEFVEDVPYDETRTYIKLVLRNVVHYMRLETDDDQIAFPQWCLTGLAGFRS